MKRNCKNCKYWELTSTGEVHDIDGKCHRYPPIVSDFVDCPLKEKDGFWIHAAYSQPMSRMFDWCGEWKKQEDRDD